MPSEDNLRAEADLLKRQSERRNAWLLLIVGLGLMIFALPGALVLFILIKAWMSMP